MKIDTENLTLKWSEAPWDTVIFGFPVFQIDHIEVHAPGAIVDFQAFEQARELAGSSLVSCRLACDRLRESMLLESKNFRFIEMVLHPELARPSGQFVPDNQGLNIKLATGDDLPEIIDIAGRSFGHERFHVDPRLPAKLGDLRYQNWVRSSLDHARQRLHVLRDDENVVAFFVTEMLPDGTCYWHLNAVAPVWQGQGYGRRAWSAMISQAWAEGASRIQSSIVARNNRVLNIYARLGFNFTQPAMTFHWVRE